MAKEIFDKTFGVLLFFILLIPMCVVALLVLFTMGRPVLFVQERPGFRGKPFKLLKFRTMGNERDEEGSLLPDGSRLTHLGRRLRALSLDELPQLANVIRGELSFVGPRPLLMAYLPLYTEHQARRHEVKPGITGWAQVNGRNALSWEERLELDVWYVDHRTFFLDLRILWLTVAAVVKRQGIGAPGCETMPQFKGSGPSTGGRE